MSSGKAVSTERALQGGGGTPLGIPCSQAESQRWCQLGHAVCVHTQAPYDVVLNLPDNSSARYDVSVTFANGRLMDPSVNSAFSALALPSVNQPLVCARSPLALPWP